MGDCADRDGSAATVAIILAAGSSSRVGAFKPLLPFGEQTLISRGVANLRAADVRRRLASARAVACAL